MRFAVFLFLLLFFAALTLGACDGLRDIYAPWDPSNRRGESEARALNEHSDNVAESLPVFPNGLLKSDSHTRCEGQRTWGGASCSLSLSYETSRPLAEVLQFYETQLVSQGWKLRCAEVSASCPREVQTSRFEGHRATLTIYVRIPFQACPDPHLDLDAARDCEERWISSEGGEYVITIYPQEDRSSQKVFLVLLALAGLGTLGALGFPRLRAANTKTPR